MQIHRARTCQKVKKNLWTGFFFTILYLQYIALYAYTFKEKVFIFDSTPPVQLKLVQKIKKGLKYSLHKQKEDLLQ